METKIQPQNNMKRSSSSNSESHNHLDSPHSSYWFQSPLQSDHGDLPDTPPYASPTGSLDNSKAMVVLDKFTPSSPPRSPHTPENVETPVTAFPPVVVFNRPPREAGHQDTTTSMAASESGGGSDMVSSRTRRRRNTEETGRKTALVFRLSEVVLCLISFSVMASDKTPGWSGDSFDRYKEYRYCLSVNVIGSVYSGFQACNLAYSMAKNGMIHHHLRRIFDFFMDQILAYLLISSASSAATRVDDWQSNWGKDEFTKMASASVAMAFLAFVSFACSSLISGYNLGTLVSS